jgi:hypothetical protein
MSKAFISHASADRDLAYRICELLEDRGITCWIAPRDISAGFRYGEEIIRGIESSTALVLLLSEHANNSKPVCDEVERAWSRGKLVVPIRVRDIQPSPGLELYVSSAQWVDAWRAPIETEIDRVARAIEHRSGAGRTPDANPMEKSHAHGASFTARAFQAKSALEAAMENASRMLKIDLRELDKRHGRGGSIENCQRHSS